MVIVYQPLARALRQYEQRLIELESAKPVAKPDQVLNVLLARDRVKNILNTVSNPSSFILLKLVNFDKRLERQKVNIVQIGDYINWRNSFEPPVSSWWWYFEVSTRPWWQGLGWLWNILTLFALTIFISLLVDAVPRFLAGGLDFSSVLTVIIPSLLALLTTGALTPMGQEAQSYCQEKFPRCPWPVLIMIIAILLATTLACIHQFYFDDFAVYFNNEGLKSYQAQSELNQIQKSNHPQKKKLDQALSNYQKAVALNPSYAEAHYNLALVYEDLQQFDKAIIEYQLSVLQDSSENNLIRLKAYNNWGRILLVKKDYVQAINPLLEGKNIVDEEKAKIDKHLQTVQYALLKNLAWAQLELKNYVEAKFLLQEGISLNAKKAAAYCLLAQVLEAQKQQTEAVKNWNNCISYADISSPDEYLWLSVARSKVK